MKLFQLAVASVVDANTGYGLAHNGSPIDYAAAAQHGRNIRSKSITAVFRLIKDQLVGAISSYRANSRENRQIAVLGQLNEHLLKDIGLSPEDVLAAKSGQVTLEQLDTQRRGGDQKKLLEQSSTARVSQQTLQLDPINEAVFSGAKCA